MASNYLDYTGLQTFKEKCDEAYKLPDGNNGQVLISKGNGSVEWKDLSSIVKLEDILAYGVEFDVTVADPHLTRIGNMSLHKSLPIQSQLKGCIAQGGKIMYWLDESDWRFRKNPTIQTLQYEADFDNNIVNIFGGGLQYEDQWIRINDIKIQIDRYESGQMVIKYTDEMDAAFISTSGEVEVEFGSILNGYDGTVRVYCPEFYIKSESQGNKRRVWISTSKIDETWTHQEALLVDAYRCTVLNTAMDFGYLNTLPVNTTISVVNTSSYCRGGNNTNTNDSYISTDPFRTQLGKPRTNVTRANMRTYARNGGSQLLSYDQYKNIFYWLYVIEYANFNSQETYNSTLTSEGYHQGGLGTGITNMQNWSEYNTQYPLTPCGYGNSLGNGTGVVSMVIPEFTYGTDNTTQATQTLKMPRWRGFDNPFGDIWTNLDGIIIDADADNHENNMNYIYTCQDASKYADTINDSYVKVGEQIHTEGWIKTFDLGGAAHIIPSSVGGNNTQYICDYTYSGEKNTNLRTLRVGGSATHGSGAGLGCFGSHSSVSVAWAGFGFRAVSGLE